MGERGRAECGYRGRVWLILSSPRGYQGQLRHNSHRPAQPVGARKFIAPDETTREAICRLSSYVIKQSLHPCLSHLRSTVPATTFSLIVAHLPGRGGDSDATLSAPRRYGKRKDAPRLNVSAAGQQPRSTIIKTISPPRGSNSQPSD